ncbi:hypothetical protein TrRE_jg1672 [Triparma retinervis]|uniref:FAD dependent oxidoreductase domain-containing protein n=1 Tax=Triparma retinervis TaxID=2557542 RepID=A0A9W7A3F0_9STRA|nr:hypothetical protein TrRE_jg1672 [Triparma retinervis]
MFLTAGRGDFKYLPCEYTSCVAPKKGLRVTLLEKQTVACEATGLSCGTLYSSGPPKSTLPPEASSIPTFRYISSLFYQHLQSLEDIEYTKCGCIQLATTPEELKFAKESYKKEVNNTSKPEAVTFCKSLKEVRDILPEAGPSVLGGVYTPNSGQVNAGLAAHKCAEIAEERGAVIRENVAVKRITKSDGVYMVVSSKGDTFKAKAVVVAAGAWANDVLGKNKVDVYKDK